MRALLILVVALVLAAPARAGVQNPPTMPNSTANEKRCKGVTSKFDARFRVWVVTGKVSCKTARRVVRQSVDAKGWTYFDWTKGGNGPWSDVWTRAHNTKTIGAIINA